MQTTLLKKFTVAAAAIAAGMMAGGAQAATCDATTNNGQTVTYTVNQGNPDTIQDTFCATGNDSNTIDNDYELFSLTGWNLGQKREFDDNATSGDGEVTFAMFELTDDDGSGFLDWELSNPAGYESVALVLKQSTTFAAFLLDTTNPLSGTWSISGPGADEDDDVSHSSAYYTGEPNVIPLPAAGWLLLAGIGGLAAFRQRKSV